MRRSFIVAIVVLSCACAPSIPSAPSSIVSVYNRSEWRHWIDQDGDCQDTRQEVLIEESLVTPKLDAGGCRVIAGKWLDEYTGTSYTDPADLDIDHRVPLANAHRSGGWTWDHARKEIYANDLLDHDHLIAVSAGANRSKSDKGPDVWRPPLRESWCHYAATWRAVKGRWMLTITPEEEQALIEMLATCR